MENLTRKIWEGNVVAWLAACLACILPHHAVHAAQQVDYVPYETSTILAVPTPTIVLDPRVQRSDYVGYHMPRTYGFGDFNGDGLMDIVVASSFFNVRPERALQIFINLGNNSFEDRSVSLIKGSPFLTGVVNRMIVADFNEDGKPDIFTVDHGLELDSPLFPGHRLGLLLSQSDGTWIDGSSRISPNDAHFNHSGAVADIDGDGHLDVVVARLGVPDVHFSDGVSIFRGDGKGNFAVSNAGLPPEVAFLPWSNIDYTRNRQNIGCVDAADVDGDGRVDLITGTYSYPDHLSGLRTLRFLKQLPNGAFDERRRFEIPGPIREVGYVGPIRGGNDQGLGCAAIYTADLFGNGRRDVVVLWEGANKSYIEILRNEGDFNFTDATVPAVGGYATNGTSGPAANYRLIDVNGDGLVDIVHGAYGEPPTKLVAGSFIFLNNGNGSFAPWIPQRDGAPMSVADLTKLTGCDVCSAAPLVMDVDGDGRIDVALMRFTLTPAPIQVSQIRINALLARSPFLVRQNVEFYNQALDHYFVTWIPEEIAGLDSGISAKGWRRTGYAFKTFTAGGANLSPVCRFYIPPHLGDSHFYGRGTSECDATARNNPQFVAEDTKFMHMFLPVAGACRPNTVPVYRVFSNRPDANHRYMVDRWVRGQMAGKGWLIEGDGSDAIVMCAPE